MCLLVEISMSRTKERESVKCVLFVVSVLKRMFH